MNTKKIFSTLAAALLLALPYQASAAIDPASVQKLVAADETVREKSGAFQQPAGMMMAMASYRTGRDEFGDSVALSGDTAIIGAPFDDDKGQDAGAAYIFSRAADGRWSQQAKLTAAAADAYDWFGRSVSLSTDGNTALIGATGDDDMGNQNGAAYIFTRTADNGWTQTAKLTVAKDSNMLGRDLNLSGDGQIALCIASPYAVYVFSRTADGRWSQQAKLTTAEDGVRFGGGSMSLSLSANGSTALIGAYSVAEESVVFTTYHPGSVYVFSRAADGRWSQQAKLAAADGELNNSFGSSLSLSADGSKALIGARGDKYNKGAAYVFSHAADGRWSQQAKLVAAGIGSGDSFGTSASLSADGGTALILGWNDRNPNMGGLAYVFTRTGSSWEQQNNLVSKDFVISASLSPDGGTALLGSNKDAAYIFTGSAKPSL